MKKLAFFDLNIVGIGRYPLKIANEINRYDKSVKIYFLYEEDPNKKYNEIVKLLPKNSKVIQIKKANYKYIKNLLISLEIDSLLVMAQRIPDNAVVSVANEVGINTFKFQHGLYIPFMKRTANLFISKFFKTIRYIQYANVVANATQSNKIDTILEYMKVFLKGKNITKTKLPLNKINAKKVFVYGDYWKEYHKEHYGYNLSQQIIVGYPDLIMLEDIKKQPKEDAICYICQTLVEDGRLDRKYMEDFIQKLANSIEDKKLYLKLHPRSDLSLYKPLKNKNVIFTNEFPYTTKYIGHYSSMLAISLYLTNEVFLWKFKNHNEYPFYFVENAKVLSNEEWELKNFIQNKNIIDKNNNIERYFYYNKNLYNNLIKYLMEKE